MSDTMTPAQKALNDKLTQNLDRILAVEEQIKDAEAKGFGTADLKQQVADMSKDNAKFVDDLKAITERIDAGEAAAKKAAAYTGGSGTSLGTAFTSSEAFKSVQGKGRDAMLQMPFADLGPAAEAMKAVTLSANINPPQYVGQIIPLPGVTLSMRDLIPGGTTDRDIIKFVRMKVRGTGAGTVTPGDPKPEAAFEVEDVEAAVRKIAAYVIVNDEQLDDVSALRSLIDAELTYAIRLKEDQQLLNGNGTAPNLQGILPLATQADTVLSAAVASRQRLDVIRAMIAQLQRSNYAPDGIVLHPDDWFKIETTKTSEGAYIFANPQGVATPRLWGLRVATTTQIAADSALVGAFSIGSQIFDRMGLLLKVGHPNDTFLRNRTAILTEERLAHAVKRPEAFVTGDLTPA